MNRVFKILVLVLILVSGLSVRESLWSAPNELTVKQMRLLFDQIFSLTPTDHQILILVDLPRKPADSTVHWAKRIIIAKSWHTILQQAFPDKKIILAEYQAVQSNNADLPQEVLVNGKSQQLESLLTQSQIVVALTEHSATAPLKNLAAKFKSFRGITMPGFMVEMMPAMFLDYNVVGHRTTRLKELLEISNEAQVIFHGQGVSYPFQLDLNGAKVHESNGRVQKLGMVGNFPSGETYAVPNEADDSKTSGILPVELDGEIVLYKVEKNRAIGVISNGTVSERERQKLVSNPAYGNIAEFGLGVLSELGVKAVGRTLLDEKLGLHIAFGRSDHFGGRIGAKDFNGPAEHIDRVYVPEIQPRIIVKSVVLKGAQLGTFHLMKDHRFIPNLFCSKTLKELIRVVRK